MLTQDREINEFLGTHGAILREHQTRSNKWDEDYGVASVSTLFANWQNGQALIELPTSSNQEMVKALVEQLTTWAPDAPKHQRTDVVMALWFVELACRDRVKSMSMYQNHHVRNPFATKYDLSQQSVMDVREYERLRLLQSTAF